MSASSVLSQVLDDLQLIIPAEGPTRGQRRLLDRLLSYRNGTPDELERIRRLLDPQDATTAPTTNREDIE